MSFVRTGVCGAFAAALLATLGVCPVRAQSFEAGATVGIGARGGEAEFLRGEARPIGGVRIAALWSDRVETAFRYAWLSLPPFSGTTTYFSGTFTSGLMPLLHVLTERTAARQFATAEVLYVFRRGSRVRPFAGGGLGAIFERMNTTCDVPSCERVLPGLSWGRTTASYLDPVAIAGMSGVVRRSVVLRGGVELHRPAGEDLSLFETFVAVGYRF